MTDHHSAEELSGFDPLHHIDHASRTVTSCLNTHQQQLAKALGKDVSLHRGSSHNVITNERRAVAVSVSHFIVLTLQKPLNPGRELGTRKCAFFIVS